MNPNPAPDSKDERPRHYRVVQWGTGDVGRRALRGVIKHPILTLVGVYVRNPDKVGRDAGVLAGLDTETGIFAGDSIDEIIALAPDCVLYMPRIFRTDEVCQLLNAGLNVVAIRAELHHPPSMDAEVCARLVAACWVGRASLYSAGTSPGFITEAIPIALGSLQRSIDLVTIEEHADFTEAAATAAPLLEMAGFGIAPPECADPQRLAHILGEFEPSLRLVADSLSLPLHTVEVHGEYATATRRARIGAWELEPGTVGAQRITITGSRAGRELLRFRTTWYCTRDLDPGWPVEPSGWRVRLTGDSPLEMNLRTSPSLERMGALEPNYTANRAVNAVPNLCAAPPGIRTTLDLPPLRAVLE